MSAHRLLAGASCLFALTCLAAGCVSRAPSQSAPELILHNGHLFTANPLQPHAQALAIRGERIVAVGSDEDILALANQSTERIDLRGHTVIPGINDAHEHLAIWPTNTAWLDTGSFNPDWDAVLPP